MQVPVESEGIVTECQDVGLDLLAKRCSSTPIRAREDTSLTERPDWIDTPLSGPGHGPEPDGGTNREGDRQWDSKGELRW